MKTYYWDFFGPHADGTAAHFVRHLQEFFATNGIEGCEVDTTSGGAGHSAARCRAPQAAEEPIQRALRPRRIESGDT